MATALAQPRDGDEIRGTRGFRNLAARKEAAALFALIKSGESPATLRALIHPGHCGDIYIRVYRAKVLQAFDRLVRGESRRGRGRRFTEYEKERIREAVRSRRRSADIESEFGVDVKTVTKFRRELGDTTDRRRWQKISAAQIAEAEHLLASGLGWRKVARQVGMAIVTLQRRTSFRKGKRR